MGQIKVKFFNRFFSEFKKNFGEVLSFNFYCLPLRRLLLNVLYENKVKIRLSTIEKFKKKFYFILNYKLL
jgi:hypothetical protein